MTKGIEKDDFDHCKVIENFNNLALKATTTLLKLQRTVHLAGRNIK